MLKTKIYFANYKEQNGLCTLKGPFSSNYSTLISVMWKKNSNFFFPLLSPSLFAIRKQNLWNVRWKKAGKKQHWKITHCLAVTVMQQLQRIQIWKDDKKKLWKSTKIKLSIKNCKKKKKRKVEKKKGKGYNVKIKSWKNIHIFCSYFNQQKKKSFFFFAANSISGKKNKLPKKMYRKKWNKTNESLSHSKNL